MLTIRMLNTSGRSPLRSFNFFLRFWTNWHWTRWEYNRVKKRIPKTLRYTEQPLSYGAVDVVHYWGPKPTFAFCFKAGAANNYREKATLTIVWRRLDFLSKMETFGATVAETHKHLLSVKNCSKIWLNSAERREKASIATSYSETDLEFAMEFPWLR